MSLQDQIQNEIENTVPDMIDQAITSHTHNGSDSPNILGNFLANAPQATVTLPNGGTTIDSQSRAAITDIYNKLVALGLFN